MTLPITPEAVGSQTVGPYYAIGLDHLVSETLAGTKAVGQQITLTGTVFDADGEPVSDAILELWQASSSGHYQEQQELGLARDTNAFLGFARLSTHSGGTFRVQTVIPSATPYTDGCEQAPHLVVLLFMRGLMRHLVTRIYLPDQPLNEQDPVLALVPAARRKTLIATRTGPDTMRWDINLQGPQETVFFEC